MNGLRKRPTRIGALRLSPIVSSTDGLGVSGELDPDLRGIAGAFASLGEAIKDVSAETTHQNSDAAEAMLEGMTWAPDQPLIRIDNILSDDESFIPYQSDELEPRDEPTFHDAESQPEDELILLETDDNVTLADDDNSHTGAIRPFMTQMTTS